MEKNEMKIKVDEVLLQDLGELATDLARARRVAKRLSGRVKTAFPPAQLRDIKSKISKRIPAKDWIQGDIKKSFQWESGADECAACSACAICLLDGPFPDFEVAALVGLVGLG